MGTRGHSKSPLGGRGFQNGTSASFIEQKKNTINYMDLLKEMKRDFDMKRISDNSILNALIATKGNKIHALNKLLGEREYYFYYN